nr:CPBP family intramembrane glutamic endopeptidase [Halomicrobium katesii]
MVRRDLRSDAVFHVELADPVARWSPTLSTVTVSSSALAAGFSLSPWLLAVVSSVVFGAAHGAQGRVGMLVTGGLGLALAAGFVLTDSLLVVVVAHYLVNAWSSGSTRDWATSD